MNLKILLILLIYYVILSLTFVLGSDIFNEASGYNITDSPLNSSDLTGSEIDQGGLFGTGVSFSRFFLFVTFGIGLPSDTPQWFTILFFAWQTIITVLAIGFIISSIWDG